MKKFNTKELLKTTIEIVILYALFAFMTIELNPLKWGIIFRVFGAILFTASLVSFKAFKNVGKTR